MKSSVEFTTPKEQVDVARLLGMVKIPCQISKESFSTNISYEKSTKSQHSLHMGTRTQERIQQTEKAAIITTSDTILQSATTDKKLHVTRAKKGLGVILGQQHED